MAAARYEYVERIGLPPDEDRGLWFGYNAAGNVYVMTWHPWMKCWHAVGFDFETPYHNPYGDASVYINGNSADFIVRCAPAPLPWQDIKK